MGPIELNKKRIFILFAAIVAFFLISSHTKDGQGIVSHIPIPNRPTAPKPDPDTAWDYPEHDNEDKPQQESGTTKVDLHPINRLMQEADDRWRMYEGDRSQTFRQVLEKYRRKYGRHPPPGFKEWYKFAREKNVFNIDDFEQVMDDLRPFWAVDPLTIRRHAAHMWESESNGAACLHVRNKKVVRVTNGNWRSDTFKEMVEAVVKYLPDMDIAMNRLDQPRVIVPWEDLQEMLKNETESRVMLPEAADSFTDKQEGLLDVSIKDPKDDNSTRADAHWFGAPGKPYMNIASKGCPPESPARQNMTIEEADAFYKEADGKFVNNFNTSSDLCVVGPTLHNLHGLLYSASSIQATHTLVPIFGECKVNINNDILFPANMYYRDDKRYIYNAKEDVDWREKADNVIWRGVTSGGVQLKDNWQTMHRQRLVQLFNGTFMWKEAKEVAVLAEEKHEIANENTTYTVYPKFKPSTFADEHSDIGFVEAWGCIPDCSFYNDVFSWKPGTTLTSQFKSRFLIDVDGHSFSGRWRAFLQSKSLGLKATIFREWHDSRLFAWRHFVPVDNRYDDMYAVLTYFIGYGSPNMEHATESEDRNPEVFIASHDKEAQRLARQGREWANKVLRKEDIDVYMFRLLLEYGRIIDDNRDHIGYSGDGSELDAFDKGEAASGWGINKWWGGDKKGQETDNSTDSGPGTTTPEADNDR